MKKRSPKQANASLKTHLGAKGAVEKTHAQIEARLANASLKTHLGRSIPKVLMVDNGSGYRSAAIHRLLANASSTTHLGAAQ